jgi:hypothetical protein
MLILISKVAPRSLAMNWRFLFTLRQSAFLQLIGKIV